MYRQYFKQALFLLKENKLVSGISVIGTALSVSIIMVIIILIHANLSDYAPEINRSRTLYVKWGVIRNKKYYANSSSSKLSILSVQTLFYPLKSAEAVTAVMDNGTMMTSIPGNDEQTDCNVKYTDDAFWKVFSFDLVAGRTYNRADCKSGMKQAVINLTTARKLYGNAENALGKSVDLNYVSYKVIGVVKDVSRFCQQSYSDIWAPYTTNSYFSTIGRSGNDEGKLGGFECYILAHNKQDFKIIRNEVATRLKSYNTSSRYTNFYLTGQPDDFFTQMLHDVSNQKPDTKGAIFKYMIIFLIVLLVPSVNLSGITLSRMRKRLPEIGIRKAFGATKSELVYQVLSENFILTLIGGFLGLAFSYLAIYLFKSWLLNIQYSGIAAMNVSMISPAIFGIALLFCLLLNLLSAGIPAWRTSRRNIVNALNE